METRLDMPATMTSSEEFALMLHERLLKLEDQVASMAAAADHNFAHVSSRLTALYINLELKTDYPKAAVYDKSFISASCLEGLLHVYQLYVLYDENNQFYIIDRDNTKLDMFLNDTAAIQRSLQQEYPHRMIVTPKISIVTLADMASQKPSVGIVSSGSPAS